MVIVACISQFVAILFLNFHIGSRYTVHIARDQVAVVPALWQNFQYPYQYPSFFESQILLNLPVNVFMAWFQEQYGNDFHASQFSWTKSCFFFFSPNGLLAQASLWRQTLFWLLIVIWSCLLPWIVPDIKSLENLVELILECPCPSCTFPSTLLVI